MFNIIKCHLFAFDGDQLLPPGAIAEQPGRRIDIPDAIDRIMVEDHINGQRIVEIDPISHLFETRA